DGNVADSYVRSLLVLALFVPPVEDTTLNQSPRLMFAVPSKRRCSTKCARPDLPGSSSFARTWYITPGVTTGAVLSWCRITCIPLGSLYSSNLICCALSIMLTKATAAADSILLFMKLIYLYKISNYDC